MVPGDCVPRTLCSFTFLGCYPVGLQCREAQPVRGTIGTTDEKPALSSAGLPGPVESALPSFDPSFKE